MPTTPAPDQRTSCHDDHPPRAPSADTARPRRCRPYLAHGRLLTVGAALWAAATALTGVDPGDDPVDLAVFCVGSGAFQLGLLALLRVLWRTRGLGEGRLARAVLRVETALVLLAICSTLVDGFGISDLDPAGLAGPRRLLAAEHAGDVRHRHPDRGAGRWTGATRWWPMVAESWALVCIPTLVLFGATAATVVSCVHLLVGYAVLGLLVSRKA